MISELDRAIMFATSAHAGQVRKYTGEPYIEHPKAVMNIVREYVSDENVLMAAVLHDVIEDCGVTDMELAKEFGNRVAVMVWQLSDPVMGGNRALRKRHSRMQLAAAPGMVQSIKLADMIHNTESIQKYDPKFWKQYRVEKLLLLGAMNYGHPQLWKRAYDQCVQDLV